MESGRRPGWARIAAVAAALFGLLTIASGGRALFGGVDARAAVGDAVPFVLWFNFLAGFFYVAAAIGLFLWRPWGAILASLVAAATLVVLVAFGWHVAAGGPFEFRTVGAMALRSVFWIVLAAASLRLLSRQPS